MAVGLWYRDFSETTDDEVRGLLQAAAREHAEDRPIGERVSVQEQHHTT
jgi:predicted phosphoribosyltransferase